MHGPTVAARRRARAAAWVLVLALAALGCETLTDPFQHKDAFRETQKRFTQYVRWGNFAAASEFVDPEIRADFLALAPDASEVRFTDYEILRMDIGEDVSSASVDVRYHGYLASLPVERSIDVTQDWSRDPATGRWSVRLEVAKLRGALSGTP